MARPQIMHENRMQGAKGEDDIYCCPIYVVTINFF